MELYRKVRLACRDGMSERAAARHFGVSRQSVRKMLQFSVPPGYRRTAPVRRPKLDEFTALIEQWLEDDRRHGYEDTPEDTPAGAHGTEYRETLGEGNRGRGGDELEARQNADSSTHRELEKNTVLTAGTASRRGTRLSCVPSMLGSWEVKVFYPT